MIFISQIFQNYVRNIKDSILHRAYVDTSLNKNKSTDLGKMSYLYLDSN